MLDIAYQKDKIAIVVVGYNRIDSMKRLLCSIENATYSVPDVPLVISIDASGDEALYDYVRNFQWSHGIKYVNIENKRLGLVNHILQCGDLTKYFKAVIVLEDDLFVSEYFYDYVLAATVSYYNENRIACFSLFRCGMYGTAYNIPHIFLNDGRDGFLYQTAESWGECWTDKQWPLFKEWMRTYDETHLQMLDMPRDFKDRTRAWSKFFMGYVVDTNKYTLFPSISLTTCFADKGEHGGGTSTYGQVDLLCGEHQYHFNNFDKMVKYDIFCNNEAIYDYLQIGKSDLCIDYYGTQKRPYSKRYVLSPYKRPYGIIKSFALSLRPMELNIKYNIRGEELFLYDTSIPIKCRDNKWQPISFADYYLRNFSSRLLIRYSFVVLYGFIERSIKKILRLK